MSISPSGAWLSRRRRVSFSALFLVYLLYVGIAVADDSRGIDEAAGFVVLGIFALTYLEIVDRAAQLHAAAFAAAVGLLLVLTLVELLFARAVGLSLIVYVTAVLVARLGQRAWPIVVVFTLGSLFGPTVVPGWHDSLGDSVGLVTPVAVPVVALVSFGLRELAKSNFALAQARAEVARLGADAERARISRDLHDLLGHSLTTITVKAGLAHRIGRTDTERALEEIAAVEALARRSLQDVRAAVAGYREVTLTGELAAGGELLRAAGITAELPRAVDMVNPAHQELLGWVVREGITNVVRHGQASFCTVRISTSTAEIIDDGDPAEPRCGHNATATGHPATGSGLAGLRERVASAGGTLEVGPEQPSGWRLRVSLPESTAR